LGVVGAGSNPDLIVLLARSRHGKLEGYELEVTE
jgi:hypothetical protein